MYRTFSTHSPDNGHLGPAMDIDREAGRAALQGVTKSRTRLSSWTELTDEHRGACIFSNDSFVWIYAQE